MKKEEEACLHADFHYKNKKFSGFLNENASLNRISSETVNNIQKIQNLEGSI